VQEREKRESVAEGGRTVWKIGGLGLNSFAGTWN